MLAGGNTRGKGRGKGQWWSSMLLPSRRRHNKVKTVFKTAAQITNGDSLTSW